MAVSLSPKTRRVTGESATHLQTNEQAFNELAQRVSALVLQIPRSEEGHERIDTIIGMLNKMRPLLTDEPASPGDEEDGIDGDRLQLAIQVAFQAAAREARSTSGQVPKTTLNTLFDTVFSVLSAEGTLV